MAGDGHALQDLSGGQGTDPLAAADSFHAPARARGGYESALAATTPATTSATDTERLTRGVNQAGAWAASQTRAPVAAVVAATAPVATHCEHMPRSVHPCAE